MMSTDLSRVLIGLMKGVTFRDDDAALWQALVSLQSRVRDHVAVLGLELILDEAEGHAYLRQQSDEERGDLPRLVSRRALGFPVSLLLVLLRKKLAEADATSGETRLILHREEIVDLMRVFLADTANEARLMDRMDQHVSKVVELGFLRRLRGRDDQFEVARILKAFVDAQWLGEFDRRLAAYRTELAGTGEAGTADHAGHGAGDAPGVAS